MVASGSRDQTTRLWDIETQKQLQSRKIERNVVTAIKWVPGQPNLFLEGSEDLTLRIWDVKQRPFKPSFEVKVGTNFITSCDVILSDSDIPLLATGHRGFNNEGAEVKLWGLR